MALPQDIVAFKAQFPIFENYVDADIAAALNTADVFLDGSGWPNPTTFALARLLWVANLLVLMRMTGLSVLTAGALFGGSSIGDLFVRSITFGERNVSFEQRRLFANASSARSSPADILLSATVYGLQYRVLRDRAFPAVAVI